MIAPSLEIRPRRLEDAPAIARITRELDEHHASGLPQIFHVRGGGSSFDGPSYDDIEREIFVATFGTEVAGFVDVRVRFVPESPIDIARKVGHVTRLGVAASHRRRGAGRALMTTASTWTRGHGCREMELSVYEFNTGALALYESLGYATLMRKLRQPLEP